MPFKIHQISLTRILSSRTLKEYLSWYELIDMPISSVTSLIVIRRTFKISYSRFYRFLLCWSVRGVRRLLRLHGHLRDAYSTRKLLLFPCRFLIILLYAPSHTLLIKCYYFERIFFFLLRIVLQNKLIFFQFCLFFVLSWNLR